MRKMLAIAGVTLGVMAGASALSADSRAPSDSSFNARITHYMALRRQVEQRVPAPRISDNRAEIHGAADALAEAIRRARSHDARGDIFSAKIAADFRRIIQTVAKTAPRAVRVRDARPTVNSRFDWDLDADMPALLIQALPPLPPELQYRLVGCDLVLVDIVAGLVIDILPAALADGC